MLTLYISILTHVVWLYNTLALTCRFKEDLNISTLVVYGIGVCLPISINSGQ